MWFVSQNGAQIRHFSENVHVVTSHSWYSFVETRRIRWRDRNYVRNWTQTWTRMSHVVYRHISVCQKVSYRYDCLQWTRLTAFALVKPVFSGMVRKKLHTEKVLQVKSFGCTSFRVGQRWNTRCDILNVTHRHVFVSQQVNDPRRTRRRRRCGQPAMQQSAGVDERNSAESNLAAASAKITLPESANE